MAQVPYRINLGATSFPFLSELQGRTVIVKGQDQNYIPSIISKEDLDKDIGVPQVYYCHNVMPTAQGFISVGYLGKVNQVSSTETEFRKAILLRDSDENKAFWAHTADGRNYILLAGSGVWQQINSITGTAGKKVTVAYVSGETYIYFEKIGCYKYDFALNQLVSVTLTGLTATDILGIVSAYGYLVAYTKTDIAWSSTTDVLDFVPSTVTGAGGGRVEGARGRITTCASYADGFYIFTTANTVAAIWSNDIQYPFHFKDIAGSGGLLSLDLVTYDSNASSYYVYTSSGLQTINARGANTIFPEVTDFIAGELFEDFNETTYQFTASTLTAPMKKKIVVIADRYLIFSYGVNELTHALVYDLAQKRFGKLKITHTDCLEWTITDPEAVETPKKSIAFLKKDGTVVVADMSTRSTTSAGILLLGKYQYIRTRMLTLETVEFENIRSSGAFVLKNLYTLDGKNFLQKDGYLADATGLNRKYNFRVTGMNHSLLLKGNFNVVSGVIHFHIHGRR